MGGNSSPLIADLFLGFCEFLFMQKLLREKRLNLAKSLSNNTRYIDDICVFNYKKINNLLSDTYPTALIAERSGNDDKHVVYLEIDITITLSGIISTVFFITTTPKLG